MEKSAFIYAWTTPNYVWLNPPYSKEAGGILRWLQEAYFQATEKSYCSGVVCLIISDTSTKYFSFAMEKATKIIFLKGRVKFNNVSNSPKFGSCLVVFENKTTKKEISIWDWKKESFLNRYIICER